jgi:hypothetical protein
VRPNGGLLSDNGPPGVLTLTEYTPAIVAIKEYSMHTARADLVEHGM